MWHWASLCALPLVTLLAGIVSLHVDPGDRASKKWILMATLILGAAGSIAFGISSDVQSQRDKKTADENEKTLLSIVEDTSQKAGNILGTLTSFGLRPGVSISQVPTSVSADEGRTALLPKILQSNLRGGITKEIWYFPKDVDGPVVIKALKQGGFGVVLGNGKPANANLPTNAVWVGNDIDVNDAKFVALTLVRAGVGIKAVRRLPDGGDKKAKTIEVGTDHALVNNAPLTVDQIEGLQTLTK